MRKGNKIITIYFVHILRSIKDESSEWNGSKKKPRQMAIEPPKKSADRSKHQNNRTPPGGQY
jgi:hypothetical protein